MVYLDWNATAPLREVARNAWLAAYDSAWANPSSIHGLGQQSRCLLDDAKRKIGHIIGAKPHEIVFTSGGTEANALAIAQVRGKISVSAIDHSSILRNAPQAELLSVDGNGRVRLTGLASDSVLVAFQFANNELGTMQDVPTLVADIRAQAPQAQILLDACQGAGKAPLHLNNLGVDYASIAGHKFGAPKGCGVLYVRSGLRLTPLFRGGRQQQDRRSGTEDAAQAAAFAAALSESHAQHAHEAERQRELLTSCFALIQTHLPAARWLAREVPRLANTMSLAHPGALNDTLVQRLDLRGFAVSVGSACMAGKGEPSHVIAALGLPRDLARSVIRVSIGHLTTAAELMAFAEAYVQEILSTSAPTLHL